MAKNILVSRANQEEIESYPSLDKEKNVLIMEIGFVFLLLN